MDIGNKDRHNSKAGRRGGSAFKALKKILSCMKDRFSTLPDEILGLIISKIPIREAVRCSILSKRWRYGYTHISKFKLSPFLLLGRRSHPNSFYPRQCVEDIISNILRFHSSYVEDFNLSISDRHWHYSTEKVFRWVQYAAAKNVQRLTLCQCSEIEIPPPATLFTCSRLTALKLKAYILSIIPNTFLGFNHLISCSFRRVKFTDDSLALFISRCPLLQRLTMNQCFGLVNPVISAPNITYLVIDDLGMKILTIECPRLITLEAQTRNSLRVNGVFLQDLSRAVRSLKLERSSCRLVELSLAFEFDDDERNFSADRILDNVSNLESLESLKKLSIEIFDDLERENEETTVPLFKLFERLPNLEFVNMGGKFLAELARDRIPPCLSSPLANLRILIVQTVNSDDSEIAVLGCLLQSTPALQILEFRPLNKDTDYREYMRFSKKMFSLRRASRHARIRRHVCGDRKLV